MIHRYRLTLREEPSGEWSAALFEHDQNIHRVTLTRATIEDAVAAANAVMIREIASRKGNVNVNAR